MQRLFHPPHVEHERLFVISVLGFLVNLVGIFVFHHGGGTVAWTEYSLLQFIVNLLIIIEFFEICGD